MKKLMKWVLTAVTVSLLFACSTAATKDKVNEKIDEFASAISSRNQTTFLGLLSTSAKDYDVVKEDPENFLKTLTDNGEIKFAFVQKATTVDEGGKTARSLVTAEKTTAGITTKTGTTFTLSNADPIAGNWLIVTWEETVGTETKKVFEVVKKKMAAQRKAAR